LPKLKRNPAYLVRNRMTWQGANLVQQPGPHNALGQIKFEFHNRYGVYLHDTPARSLFGIADRAQSHGCVRVERPIALAEALLRERPGWLWNDIERAIEAGRTQRIDLPRPMPVVLAYWTVFVDDDASAHFRTDVYKKDGSAIGS